MNMMNSFKENGSMETTYMNDTIIINEKEKYMNSLLPSSDFIIINQDKNRKKIYK